MAIWVARVKMKVFFDGEMRMIFGSKRVTETSVTRVYNISQGTHIFPKTNHVLFYKASKF